MGTIDEPDSSLQGVRVTGVLVRKLLRDLRTPWVVLALFLFCFQILFARVAPEILGKFESLGLPLDMIQRVVFEGPGIAADSLVSRRSDLSESPWLFLFFIAVLITEQALAVHLSFHLPGSERAMGRPALVRAQGG